MLYNAITKYQLGDPHGDLYLPSTTKVELCERSENERKGTLEVTSVYIINVK